MEKLRVLIVEDEPLNQEVAKVILETAGYEVACVGDGVEALERLVERGERFDAILLDMLMPKMDGLEVARRLRAHPPTRALPILCTSARASAIDAQQGLEAGCDLYLRKPYKRSDLLGALEQVMAGAPNRRRVL